MNVIFNRAHAEELRSKYTVLELETFDVKGMQLECFCVVDGDLIPPTEMNQLPHNVLSHETLVTELKAKNYKACSILLDQLHGQFGGQLDSFYEIMQERITNSTLV